MRKNFLLILTLVTVVFGAVVLFFWLQVGQTPPPSRLTLRYAPGTNNATRQTEPTFWFTNHSGKSLAVTLGAVEIQTNGAWITYSQLPLSGRLFFPTNQGNQGQRADLLAPHASGLCRLLNQQLILPTNAVWRVKGMVVEPMEGGDAVVWMVGNARLLLEARRSGNTNLPLNPFARNYHRMGRPSVVVSEAVVPQ